jgi:hypothetical protein
VPVLLLSTMAATPGPYLRKVEKQQESRRGLEALSQFLRLRLKSPVENPEDALGWNTVDIIHIDSSGEITEFCKIRCDEFDGYMRKCPDRISSLILLEDLSYEWVEKLGNRFDLEPEFFALHLRGTKNFLTGEFHPCYYPELDYLPSSCWEPHYYSLQIARPYHFPAERKEIKTLRKCVYTPRGAYISDLKNASIQERVSVYAKKDPKGSSKDIGING